MAKRKPGKTVITTKITKERVGDKMVVTTVQEEPAEIAFNEILDACTIHNDDDYGPPWKEQDGYEHELLHEDIADRFPDVQQATGWVSARRAHSGLLVLQKPEDITKWCSDRGMSKQVAFETNAAQKKRILQQLVEWYTEGWYAFGVTCKFRDYSSTGLWGIECESPDDEYLDEVRQEEADEVADEMEKDGYTITGRDKSEDAFEAFYRRVVGWHVTQGLITRERLRELWTLKYGRAS